MGKNNYFQFKQFKVVQEKSAMKVGIDGVLLGAWTCVKNTKKILDVGTGTGLIALMLAQRSNANITAIDIEAQAAQEALYNKTASSWNDRINVENISFQSFVVKNQEKFDLVVSNPPFFSNAIKATGNERILARHNDSLPFPVLMSLSAEIINETGKISLIVPVNAFDELQQQAVKNNLYLLRKTEISPNENKAVNRLMLEWGKKESPLKPDKLIIYEDGFFSEAYRALTKDFYLNC